MLSKLLQLVGKGITALRADPALAAQAVTALATALAAFGFSASPHVTAAVATIAQGLAAIVTAFLVRPVRIPVITGGLTTMAVGLATFGLHITSSEITVVMTVVAAVLGLFMPIRTTSAIARKRTSP